MSTPHIHAALIHAWADGAEIEVCLHPGKWGTQLEPCWSHNNKYRVKPPPLNLEQTAFRVSAGNIAIDQALVDDYFALGDDFWGSNPSNALITVHDMYVVWCDAINFQKIQGEME